MSMQQFLRKFFLGIFALALPTSLFGMAGQSRADYERLLRVRKNEKYFLNLAERACFIASHDDGGLGKAYSFVADKALTDLVRGSLKRYTRLGQLRNKKIGVGAWSTRADSLIDLAIGGTKAAYTYKDVLQKRYGKWWPLVFMRYSFIPHAMKSVAIGCATSGVYQATGLSMLAARSVDSWWMYYIIEHLVADVSKVIDSTYEAWAPSFLKTR